MLTTGNDGKVLLFCYGTLKRGDCRNHVLSDQKATRFIGEATTKNNWTLFSCGSFPAMVESKESDQQTGVVGELYEVDVALLDRVLDGIEGVPTLYDRGVVQLESVNTEDAEDAKITEAVTYIYQRSVSHLPHLGTEWDVNWRSKRFAR